MIGNAKISTEARPLDLGEIPCGSLPDGQRWYCWKAQPTQHLVALRNISAQGFVAFLPMMVTARDGEYETLKPMFGPYGFVAFDRSQHRWRAIHSTRGVSTLISADALTPIPVPRGIVEAIQSRGRPGDGIIDDMYRGQTFEILDGKKVRITEGPFADLHGICRWSNQKRVAVLLEVMGRLVETQVQRRDVVADV
jgi:transcriptional antiterminator RfaH